MDTKQPEALTALRDRLRSFETDHTPDGWPAVRMRDITALLDDLDNARSDNQVLRLGYAAARLEIESLNAQLKEHADELAVAYMCGASREQETATQWTPHYEKQPDGTIIPVDPSEMVPKPGAVYAALPDERAAFNAVYDAVRGRPISLREIAWRCWKGGANHGQAPAQAAPAAVAGPSEREALEEALSVMRSVSVSRDRRVVRDGCVLYLQTEEWCKWLEDDVGPKIAALLAAAPTTQPAPQQDVSAAGGDSFLLLPTRPTPDAPANTAGLSWDAYSGAQMLAYGRSCSDAALVVAAPQPSPAAQGDALDAAAAAAVEREACAQVADSMTKASFLGAVGAAIRARAAQEGKSHG